MTKKNLKLCLLPEKDLNPPENPSVKWSKYLVSNNK